MTFSPDGDRRRDRVRVLVRSSPGDRLALVVNPESNPKGFEAGGRTAGPGVTTLTWDGLDTHGKARAAGSYVIKACNVATGRCATARVLAHLRILSVFTPTGIRGVSPGERIPVVVESDRAGPFALDLASVIHPRGPGVGARAIRQPGRVSFQVPPVAGSLWLLRARSASVVTYYPLVVHESKLALDTPPARTALVVHPYVTWRAYDRADLNRDGEVDSWYSHPRRPVVPLTGPFERVRREPALSGREASPGGEQAFARWMQEHGLTAQHVTDLELGRISPAALGRYAVVVFPGHTEYYERRTYERLLAYRDAGGRLYFLQGNSFYGEVSVRPSSIARLSYRYRTRTRSDFRIAATGFRSCCWPSWISPRYRLAPDISRKLPWLLQGTDLKPGDPFGLALREVDTVDPRLSPPGTVTVASAVVPRFAASGQVHAYRWIGTRRIAHEPAAIRDRRIDIAYAHTGRGEVFSWGNAGFMQSLRLGSLPAAERAALDRVALNVWQRFTARLPATSAFSASRRAQAVGGGVFTPSPGHRLAGFALDREWLALGEDPNAARRCPVVRLVGATGGTPRSLTHPGGPTCSLGGRFWVRPGARAIGVAIDKGMWIVRCGARAIAVKASPGGPEEVLARVTGIDSVRGPFLGPVAATNWLRLFARYMKGTGGVLTGEVVSGNRRTLWAATGPVLPLGLDDEEHAVSVGAEGAIAMWHPHGARYGRVAAARARAAAVDRGVVVVLRSDRPRLDVRELSGRLVTSWPVANGAAPLLDADGGVAVYTAGGAVHELVLATGRDRVVARVPAGATLVDAQIERRVVAYAYRGGPGGAGRVVVLAR